MSSLPEHLPEPPETPARSAPEASTLEVVAGGAGNLPMAISADELAAALEHPVEAETLELEADEEPVPTEEQIEEMTAALHERYPDIQGQLDAYNAASGEPFVDLSKLEEVATTVVDQTSAPVHLAGTGSEIDSLANQDRGPAEADATHAEDGQMSDADVAALLEKVQAAEPVTPEPHQATSQAAPGVINDDEIAALFDQAADAPPAPAATAPGDENDNMSLEEIQNLVLQSESLAPAASPATTDDGSDLKILGMDDLQSMLDGGAKLNAPTGAFAAPQEEPAPAPAAGIPMVDEDAQFGAFESADEPISLVDEPTAEPVIESAEWDPEVVARVPMALAVGALALPLRFEDGKLVCLVADPIDYGAVGKLSEALRCMVETKPAPIGDVVRALRGAYAQADATSARLAMDKAARSRPSLAEWALNLWKKVA